jgi:uncharacterized membrane protein
MTKNKLYERIPRTLIKIISWRILMNISQFVGGWLISGGNLSIAMKIFGWSAVINSSCYYLHERVWNNISLGKKQSIKFLFYEKIPRTLVKIITWRIIMTISQFVIGYISSGNIWIGIGMIGYGAIVNSTIFYLHERIWNRVRLGKKIIE